MRNGLVLAEVALSLVLLIGATLLIRSDLHSSASWFRRGVVTFRIPLPSRNTTTRAGISSRDAVRSPARTAGRRRRGLRAKDCRLDRWAVVDRQAVRPRQRRPMSPAARSRCDNR
jgi:hypothetical protein